LHWWPPSGTSALGENGIGSQLRHLIMPVLTLALFYTGQFSRFVRAAMIETLRMDHVRTARAKGAPERRVVLVHALRNAMIPVVTVMALSFGTLFSGALVTETMSPYRAWVRRSTTQFLATTMTWRSPVYCLRHW
jgi:peptide/nickel transport system permease protein